MTRFRVAVIGSNGFIARHLIARLQGDASLDVRLFGRSELSSHGSQLPYGQIDFNNEAALLKSFEGVDLVYHLVSATIPSTSWEDPVLEIEKNLMPFMHLLKAVVGSGVKKIAFISSAGTVYGATQGKVNEQSDKRPFSPYGIFKRRARFERTLPES